MKFWWKGEPLIAGSLRWRIIDNDLKNAIQDCLLELQSVKALEEAIAVAHSKGYDLNIKLEPKGRDVK